MMCMLASIRGWLVSLLLVLLDLKEIMHYMYLNKSPVQFQALGIIFMNVLQFPIL